MSLGFLNTIIPLAKCWIYYVYVFVNLFFFFFIIKIYRISNTDFANAYLINIFNLLSNVKSQPLFIFLEIMMLWRIMPT